MVLTGTGLQETAAMGVIVLLGVVVNHGVLFVDRSARSRRAAPLSRRPSCAPPTIA